MWKFSATAAQPQPAAGATNTSTKHVLMTTYLDEVILDKCLPSSATICLDCSRNLVHGHQSDVPNAQRLLRKVFKLPITCFRNIETSTRYIAEIKYILFHITDDNAKETNETRKWDAVGDYPWRVRATALMSFGRSVQGDRGRLHSLVNSAETQSISRLSRTGNFTVH